MKSLLFLLVFVFTPALPAAALDSLSESPPVEIPVPAPVFDPWTETVRYEARYEVDLSGLPAGGIQLWLPTPLETFDQHLLDLQVESPLPYRETMDAAGNRMLHVEGTLPSTPAEPRVIARFDVVREPGLGLPMGEIVKDSPDDPRRHLEGHRQVPLAGVIADLGRIATEGQTSDRGKTRAIYDYVVRTMRYAKEGEGWGRGDAVWACTSKYGNCTDFHSVFLGMTRSQGVPARFVMGFPLDPARESGGVAGYHCWAQAYLEGDGWIPLDASEAWKKKRFDDYFGKLPSDRMVFSHGRDLILDPPQQGEPLNYFIYPYVEIGGEPVETPPWVFEYRRVPMRKVRPTAG